jgi:hypothetical protein
VWRINVSTKNRPLSKTGLPRSLGRTKDWKNRLARGIVVPLGAGPSTFLIVGKATPGNSARFLHLTFRESH